VLRPSIRCERSSVRTCIRKYRYWKVCAIVKVIIQKARRRIAKDELGQTPITRRPISIERLTVPPRIFKEAVFEFIFGVLSLNSIFDRDASLHRYHLETSLFRRKSNHVLRVAMLNTWMSTGDKRGWTRKNRCALPIPHLEPIKSTDKIFPSRRKNCQIRSVATVR